MVHLILADTCIPRVLFITGALYFLFRYHRVGTNCIVSVMTGAYNFQYIHTEIMVKGPFLCDRAGNQLPDVT